MGDYIAHKKRFDSAATPRDTNWKPLYQEGIEYFSPERNTYDFTVDGEKRTSFDKIFDSTGQEALSDAVSTIHSSIFPPQQNWANLKIGPALKNKIDSEIAKKLEQIVEIFFSYLHNSNFDTQIAEFLEDLLIGTASMLFQKGTRENPFVFVAVPLTQVYLEKGADSSISGQFRKWKVPNRSILDTWPDAQGKLTLEMRENINAKPDEENDFIEMTFKSKIQKVEFINGQRVINEADGFKYVVLFPKYNLVLVEREQQSSPWITSRYSVSAGEVYGRGPVLKALADCKTLNKTKELVLKNATLAVSGLWTVVNDGIMNLDNIEIKPGAMIPVSANPGSPVGASIAALKSAADFSVAEIIMADLKKSIKNILFADPLGEIDAPVKSATEIAHRAQAVAKRLGSAYGRLQHEVVKQILIRGMFILEEFNIIELGDLKIDGNNLAVVHESPLAKAQDEESIQAITRYLEIMSTFYGPQMLPTMSAPARVAQLLIDKLRVPVDAIPTEAEYNDMQAQAQQQLDAQMQQQQQQQPQTLI